MDDHSKCSATMPINSPFTRFAKKTSTYTGRPATFIIAVLIIMSCSRWFWNMSRSTVASS